MPTILGWTRCICPPPPFVSSSVFFCTESSPFHSQLTPNCSPRCGCLSVTHVAKHERLNPLAQMTGMKIIQIQSPRGIHFVLYESHWCGLNGRRLRCQRDVFWSGLFVSEKNTAWLFIGWIPPDYKALHILWVDFWSWNSRLYLHYVVSMIHSMILGSPLLSFTCFSVVKSSTSSCLWQV